MIEPDLSAYPPPEPGPEMRRDAEWQRLDPRMLLVHPIREVIRFLPVLIVFAVARTAAGGEQWQLVGVAIPIALGLMRYLTTSFRINGGRIELQRGLLNRHVLSTPVDRVRTVDLTSSLIHRLLGLTKVRIGTGTASTSDEDRIACAYAYAYVVRLHAQADGADNGADADGQRAARKLRRARA